MAVWTLGSINIDRFYSVDHLPAPGETLAALTYSEGLGGKGANMSVAVARAGAHVRHIGAVGSDGRWTVERLMEYGVDTRTVAVLPDVATGHANICIDKAGENNIVLFTGANRAIPVALIERSLSEASTGDTLLLQNETNGQHEAVRLARDMGLRVVYAAAPFDAAAVNAVLNDIDILVLNELEADQLAQAIGCSIKDIAGCEKVVTAGAKGAVWYSAVGPQTDIAPYSARVVDTTGAGDTFTGFLVAGLDRGMPMAQALDLASRAGALMVSRKGTADVIPDLKDIEDARF